MAKHCEEILSHGPPDGFKFWRCMCGAKSLDGIHWFREPEYDALMLKLEEAKLDSNA